MKSTLKQIKHILTECSDRLTGIEMTITHKKHTAYYSTLLKEVVERLSETMHKLKQIR